MSVRRRSRRALGLTFSLQFCLAFSLLFVIVFCSLVCPAVGSSALAGAPASTMLPAPPLRPGDVFDESVRTALTERVAGGIHFHKVPAWLAGTWRLSRDGHFVLDPHRSADGKDSGIDPSAYVGFECGMIADKSGQVWTRDSVGKWSESADGRSYACYLKYDETTDADNKLRSHSETVAITTGDFAKITSCLRGVSDQVNRTIGDEEIEIIKTSHSYDWQGCGKTTSQWKATYKRVSPYDYEQKIDKYGDLSLAFVQFLKEQNMVERIPEALIIHQDGGVPQDSSVPLDTSAKAPLIDQ